MLKIKVINIFHGTEASVFLDEYDHINKRQVQRLKRLLCGQKDCMCSDIAGCNPSIFEETPDGAKYILRNNNDLLY